MRLPERPRAWLRELLLGARMSLAGGRTGWLRAGLTAVGVGLGVALLLAAASVTHAAAARDARQTARSAVYTGDLLPGSDTTIVVEFVFTEFRDMPIRGLRLQPDGARPPLPPGVATMPRPGEMVASPALVRLLASPDAGLLRERLDHPVVGTIADEGLIGPGELYFYLGTDDLAITEDPLHSTALRIAGFGRPPSPADPEQYDPVLALIVAVVVVVLLVPVGLFVAAAIRFGGESRDRRLAGVRLLGADARMARRIAAGEALASSSLGLLVGSALFLIGRSFVDRFEVNRLSAFPSDLNPHPVLVALLGAGVPAVAVLITIASMRRVVIEPLGVTRRAGDVRRRLWWRALLPVLGVLLLVPQLGEACEPSVRHCGDLVGGGEANPVQVGVGLFLILVGVAVLLPWLVQVTIGRVRGGPVAWQLAIRRLQLDSSTAARAVMGIVVAVAGAVGLQTVYGSVALNFANGTGSDVSRADASISFTATGGWDGVRSVDAALRATPGVGRIRSSLTLPIDFSRTVDPIVRTRSSITVAECAALREFAQIGACAEGDVFIIDYRGSGSICDAQGCGPYGRAPSPGDKVQIDAIGTAPAAIWTVPAMARTVPSRPSPDGQEVVGVLATPSAVPAEVLAAQPRLGTSYVDLDQANAEALERLRTTVWRLGSVGLVNPLIEVDEDEQFVALRRGLVAGATLTMLLIGLSLLVSVIEQLRERRRVLAGLVAFGTRRRTLAWSVLWQAVVPVALGLLPAIGGGLAVGTLVLKIASESVRYDWVAVAVLFGVAVAVVLGVTILSLPVLWRLVRADGLRME